MTVVELETEQSTQQIATRTRQINRSRSHRDRGAPRIGSKNEWYSGMQLV